MNPFVYQSNSNKVSIRNKCTYAKLCMSSFSNHSSYSDGVCQFASTGSYPQEWQSEPYKSRLDKSPIWDNGDRRIRQICGGTRVFRPEPNNAMYSLFKQYLLNEYNYTNQNSGTVQTIYCETVNVNNN